MVKKTAAVMLLVLTISCLTGCWDYREINRLPIVVGMAVDMNEDKRHVVTAELVDLIEGGKESSIASKIIETEGDTLFDAVRNAIKFETGRLYLGHMEVVILGKQVLEKGLVEVLDFLIRDVEPRTNIWLLVSKEERAAELLRSESVTTEIRTFEISQMIEGQADLSKSFKMTISEFMNLLQCPGYCPVLPCMRIINTAGIETQAMSGTAILKRGSLAGFLTEEETKYFCFITDRVEGGILVADSEPGKHVKDVSFEILENKTKVKPVYSNGKISINVEIHVKTALGEHGPGRHKHHEGAAMHKKQAEELIKNKASALIKKMQTEYRADIFGFGNSIHMEYPKLWREIEQDWDEYFKDMEIYVNPTVEVTESGLLQESIMMEE